MKAIHNQSRKLTPENSEEKQLGYLVTSLHAGGNSRDVLSQLVGVLAEKIDRLQVQIDELEHKLSQIQPEKESPVPELLNSNEASKLLGACTATLNLYRKQGKIKALRLGKGFMYELNDLLKLASKPIHLRKERGFP